ncbi:MULTISPECIES: dynamin family protein [unclassified Clostridium]|uniref:dynamin family protein n=1 Tax=unclassified Clostridium TaxID=2614128 RepID=UPI0002982D4D|nr:MULTISPECIES: dynamin family protein [unclassified Clostridium]EKQ57239.1 MAG: dynamin family protein [Clostridium sp. Maddingley MBC34-26]
MKNFEDLKNEMQHCIERLISEVIVFIPETIQKKYAEDLLEDLQNEFYTVVILGEFKRGKSTFVNSLLGENILPVDVTPTTATINAILWDNEKYMSVYKTDGSVDTLELKNENLKNYVAGAEFDPASIQYIKLGMSANILKNKVVLVDTPGVDDLNQQRVDITYKFIPRADAVLFLLDATNPVRRTEKEFIEDNLLSNGIDKIVFIANFFDQIDEEEAEDAIEDISNRLRNALGDKDVQLFGLSARQALDAKVNEDNELLEMSGLSKVENALTKIIESGTQTEEKMVRYKKRLLMILNALERELNSLIHLEGSSIKYLDNELKSISQLIKEEEKRKASLDEYVRRQENEMLAIVRKSVNYFGENLRNDLYDMVEDYKGSDFKSFIERQIPRIIKRDINRWIQQNMAAISKMLQMLENELALGLARHFNTAITKLNTHKVGNDIDSNNLFTFQIEAEDISKTPLMAGILAAAASGLASILAGPILMPFIGMAGFPFIQKKMLEDKLAEAKNKLRPELNIAIDNVIENFSSCLDELILNKTHEIKNACSITYDRLLSSISLKIQNEINEKQNVKINSQDKLNNLNKGISIINEIMTILN